ncbi:hypothetical protein RUM43_012342 [Polyplax serrata]|uniref:Uncharacterized protein n=1 Tax=Polyplax serrata TaxID=468196 RepID=A0AAN8RZB9_POLSC
MAWHGLPPIENVEFSQLDLNIFQTEITEKEIFVVSNKTSAPSWLELGNSSGASRVEDYYDGPVVEKGLEELGKINIEDDPGFVVKFDYIDLNSKEFKDENVNLVPAGSNDTEDTLIILQNDDSGKKIFLKATSVVQITKDDVLDGKTFDQGAQSIPTVPEWLQQQIAKWTELENQEKEEKQVVTTQKNFIYSPTIPQATPKSAKVEGTTRKYNATDGKLANLLYREKKAGNKKESQVWKGN